MSTDSQDRDPDIELFVKVRQSQNICLKYCLNLSFAGR